MRVLSAKDGRDLSDMLVGIFVLDTHTTIEKICEVLVLNISKKGLFEKCNDWKICSNKDFVNMAQKIQTSTIW